MADKGHIEYRPDIDGLRAIAVLAVVAFHAFPTSRVKGGFVGVDIFFVISGYLISSNLFRSHGSDTFRFLDFYARRALRIFPALILVLASCLAFGWVGLFADEFTQLTKHAAAGAGFVANLVYWAELGYFDKEASLKPLLHLWSLGIEEQFYFLWPVVLWLCWRMKLSVLYALWVILVLSLGAGIASVVLKSPSAFYSPIPRFWELTLGALLAWRHQNSQPLKAPANLQAWLGIFLVVLSIFGISKRYAFPGAWALFPTVGAFLLISAGPSAWINRNVLANKAMVWVGLISYPLYLWHWPLLSFLRIIHDDPASDVARGSRWAAVGASILLAWLTYRLIERPIRRKPSKGRVASVLALLLFSIGTLSYVLYRNDGMADRMNLQPAGGRVLFDAYPHPQKNALCTKRYPELKDSWCLLSQDRPADVALMGDSHAHQYYRSLAAHLPGKAVLNVTYPGCLPFSARDECEEKQEVALEFLRSNDSVKTVVLTGYFSYLAADFENGNVEGRRQAAPLSEANRKLFLSSANTFLSTLLSLKKRVIVILDIPDLVFRPKECVNVRNAALSALRGNSYKRPEETCVVPAGEFRARVADHDAALAEVLRQFPAVEVFDPRPLFCDESVCRAIVDGNFLYWNSDHLTMIGADRVIEPLVRKFLER